MMRRPPRLPAGSKEVLAAALKRARTKGQHQLVLCLWLREALRMNAPQVALALGMSVSGVHHVWSRYLKEGQAIFKEPGKGGRRRQHLSRKAESDFLNRFLFSETRLNQITIDSRAIQEAYEKLVGHPVSISAVHRMLRRHDWRPVDRSVVRLPQGWAPYTPSPKYKQAQPYEPPPAEHDSEPAANDPAAK